MDEFRCQKCGDTFRSSRSNEAAYAEAERIYPGHPIERDGSGFLCDVCYQSYLRWLRRFDPDAWRRATAH